MRPLALSLAAGILLTSPLWAQSSGGSGNVPQLPVGQTFVKFEFPIWQDGKLKATLDAAEAKGITLNRAETKDLKISVYDNGAVTTTITSPKADLLVSEEKMRTSNTVQIIRDDIEATSQDCDFDLKTKKYLLRTHVKVLIKHFDLNPTPAKPNAATPADTHAPTVPPPVSSPLHNGGSLLDSPGNYSDTNSAPASPAPSSSP